MGHNINPSSVGRADWRTIGDNIIHCKHGKRRQPRVGNDDIGGGAGSGAGGAVLTLG
jgi:hypothetical protein